MQELIGEDNTCVTFDFSKDITERQEIDGIIYEPVEKLGLENIQGITGKYRLCKDKTLLVNNDEFTCAYNKNNKKILDTKGLVTIPTLTSVEVIPKSTYIIIIPHIEGEIKTIYYKLDDGEWQQTTDPSATITGLTSNTEYTVTVYVEDSNGLVSEEKTYHTKTNIPFTGIPNVEYEEGEYVSYSGVEYEVVKDNGDSVTLISRGNVTTGKYGDTTSWNDSYAKNYLNNIWINDKDLLLEDINTGGILYDNLSQSYVRLIRQEEITSDLVNESGTPFWTMTVDGNSVYYASASASKQFTKLTPTQDIEKIVYQGSGSSLDSISKKYQINDVAESREYLKALPNKTQLVISNSKTKEEIGSGLATYTISQVQEDYSCNCVEEDCECGEYECNITNTSYNTVHGSYCVDGYDTIGSNCTGGYVTLGSNCTGTSTCAGWHSYSDCAGYATNYPCAQWGYDYPCGQYGYDYPCGGWKTSYPCGGYSTSYPCRGGYTTILTCKGSVCAGSGCIGSGMVTETRYISGKKQVVSSMNCTKIGCTKYTCPSNSWAVQNVSCLSYATESSCTQTNTRSACTTTNTVSSCIRIDTNSWCARYDTNSWCTASTLAGSNCTGGSVCAQNGWSYNTSCAAYSYNTTCNGYSTTVKSVETSYDVTSKMCTNCGKKCEKCETCQRDVDFFEASGKTETCDRYTVSETTNAAGIRAVITVYKQR